MALDLCSLSLDGLSWLFGVGGSLLVSSAYVGCLYLIPSRHERDHPTTVWQRMAAAGVVTALSPLVVYALARHQDGGECLWDIVGFRASTALRSVAVSLGLNALLFAGPLLQGILHHDLEMPDRDLLSFRNFVAAPITEEIVFRGCILPLLVPSFGRTISIFVAPLFFGIAHLHHIIGGQNPKVVLFQFVYTTVFGWLTSALFVRTGSVLGPIACHAFSNYMGFPDFGGALQSKHSTLLKIVYVAGLVSFTLLLLPLTNPSLF